jgi:hypothetical protein
MRKKSNRKMLFRFLFFTSVFGGIFDSFFGYEQEEHGEQPEQEDARKSKVFIKKLIVMGSSVHWESV